MGGPYRVDIEGLHEQKIPADILIGHTPAVLRGSIVMVDSLQLNRRTVNQQFPREDTPTVRNPTRSERISPPHSSSTR